MPTLPEFVGECFFISPIGSEGTLDRERADLVRQFVVEPALLESGLQLVRADDIAEPGDINQQVIEHCVHARAVVADLTGSNANVFYELGLRDASGGFAILMTEDSRLPFDVAALRTIFFDRNNLKSAQSCTKQIAAQLSKALADPPKPIVSSVPIAEHGSDPKPIDVLRESADVASSELVNIVAERMYEIEMDAQQAYVGYSPYLMVSQMRALTDLIRGDLGLHLRLRLGIDQTGPMSLAEIARLMNITENQAFTNEARLAGLVSGDGVQRLLASQKPWVPGLD